MLLGHYIHIHFFLMHSLVFFFPAVPQNCTPLCPINLLKMSWKNVSPVDTSLPYMVSTKSRPHILKSKTMLLFLMIKGWNLKGSSMRETLTLRKLSRAISALWKWGWEWRYLKHCFELTKPSIVKGQYFLSQKFGMKRRWMKDKERT